MNHQPASLFDIIWQATPIIFAFDFGRYVIAAALISCVVWMLKRTAWKDRQIQPRTATSGQVRREFFSSLRTVGIYIIISIFTIWNVQHGYIQKPAGSFGLWSILALFAAILVAHDAYFYWSHRMMHHPKLFKTFHREHHRSTTPTPWAAYSFAIPEAFVMAIFMPIWLFLVPTPGIVIASFLIIMILRNTMGHAGLELHARGWASHSALKWISTTTHHDMHHSGSFNHNYGFYFTFWDKLMGTEHPDYVATFDRVTAPAAASRAKGASLSA